MASLTSDELSKIGAAEELQIASLRSDCTLSKPVTIWIFRLTRTSRNPSCPD